MLSEGRIAMSPNGETTIIEQFSWVNREERVLEGIVV